MDSFAAPDSIVLHPADNLMVVCRPLSKGQALTIDGNRVTIVEDIPVGHKIAKISIKRGDKIIKYGAPIGSALADIKQGQHIHLHNMKSDYIASHTREATNT